MEKFREVLWSNACDYTEVNYGNFIPYSHPGGLDMARVFSLFLFFPLQISDYYAKYSFALCPLISQYINKPFI